MEIWFILSNSGTFIFLVTPYLHNNLEYQTEKSRTSHTFYYLVCVRLEEIQQMKSLRQKCVLHIYGKKQCIMGKFQKITQSLGFFVGLQGDLHIFSSNNMLHL